MRRDVLAMDDLGTNQKWCSGMMRTPRWILNPSLPAGIVSDIGQGTSSPAEPCFTFQVPTGSGFGSHVFTITFSQFWGIVCKIRCITVLHIYALQRSKFKTKQRVAYNIVRSSMRTRLRLLLATLAVVIMVLSLLNLSTSLFKKSSRSLTLGLRNTPRAIYACHIFGSEMVVTPTNYFVKYVDTCDEAYSYGADWVVECFAPNVCSGINLSTGLVNGFCTHEWGVAAFGYRVECERSNRSTSSPSRSTSSPTLTLALIPSKPSWVNCERPVCKLDGECALLITERSNTTAKLCCSDVLHKYLTDIFPILQAISPGAFLTYGTLLGSIQDHDIIPWEADIDIAIQQTGYNDWVSWKSLLEAAGYIIFNDTILRICKLGEEQTNLAKPPWTKNMWFPYVDIYKTTHINGVIKIAASAKATFTDDWIYPLKSCQVRNSTFRCPVHADKVLTKLYGDFQTQNSAHHAWLVNARKTWTRIISWSLIGCCLSL